MNRLRNNIILVFSISAVLVFILTYAFMAAAKDNSTFFLKDLEGNRSALKDITISGYLEDRYHGRYFEMKNSILNSKFVYYQHQNDIAMLGNLQNLANAIKHDEFVYTYQYEYEISPGSKTAEYPKENSPIMNSLSIRKSAVFTDSIDIYARISKRYVDFSSPHFDTIYFSPGLRYTRSSMEIEFNKDVYGDVSANAEYQKIHNIIYNLNRETFPVPLPKMAMTILNNELYFSIVCTKEYSGRNGIYKAVNFEPWWHDSKYKGTVDTITSFDLDKTNMEVLGLDAVNDNLILLLFEDNLFKARLYNTEGQQLDELVFTDILSEKGLPEYQSFINNNCLNIYLKYENENNFTENIILSIQVEDENMSLKHKIKKNTSQETYLYNITSKGNMLYVIALTKDRDEIKIYPSEWQAPGHFIICAFKTEKDRTYPVYKGELVTDAADDYSRNLYNNDTSFGYNYYDYRQFELVNVR